MLSRMLSWLIVAVAVLAALVLMAWEWVLSWYEHVRKR